MILRISLVLSFSILAGCATYSTGRGIPAPVESRGPTGTIDPQNSNTNNGDFSDVSPIQRSDFPQTETPPARSPAIVTPAPTEPVAPASASSTLLAGVDAAIANGDLERAAALSERALRINPRDALFWYRLASVRAQQGRANEAEGFAKRALSYSADDPALTRQINTLLSDL